MESGVLEKMEELWNKWVPLLKAYKLSPDVGPRAKGHLLLHLDKQVEDDVEAVWQDSPADGLFAHNLAIALVMSAAADMVPELDAGGCAPVVRPSKDLQRAFKRLGLVWNEEGTVNRQYAVFTPLPYAGGCPICHLKDSCLKSTTRNQGAKA